MQRAPDFVWDQRPLIECGSGFNKRLKLIRRAKSLDRLAGFEVLQAESRARSQLNLLAYAPRLPAEKNILQQWSVSEADTEWTTSQVWLL